MKNIIIFIFAIYSYTAFAQSGDMHINGTRIYRQHVEVTLMDQQQPLTMVKTSGEALRDQFYEQEKNNPSIWEKMWRLLPDASALGEWAEVPCTDSKAIQVCLLMDLTGSMAQELSALQQFWPTFESALTKHYIIDQAQVHFRDEAKIKAVKRQDFGQTSDLSAIYLSQARAGGGGEESEDWPLALAQAIDSLKWSADAAARFIFFAVDAAPKYEEQTAKQLQQLLAKAKTRNLQIVPIAGVNIDAELTYLLKSMALSTNGFYLELDTGKGETDISSVVEEMQWRMAPACEEEEKKSLLNCFPNPAREYTYVALPIAAGTIRVTDASGKLIHQQPFLQGGQLKLDVSAWPAGTYSIEVRQEDRQFIARLIRQ